MEIEFWDENPEKVFQKFFPKNEANEYWHFMPNALNKTNQFCELVLINFNLVMFKHNVDLKDKSNITHSTFQIEKMLLFSN